MLLDMLGYLRVVLVPPISHLGGQPQGRPPARLGEDHPQLRRQVLAPFGAHHPEEVPGVVDLAALPRRSLEVAKDGGLQALVVV